MFYKLGTRLRILHDFFLEFLPLPQESGSISSNKVTMRGNWCSKEVSNSAQHVQLDKIPESV